MAFQSFGEESRRITRLLAAERASVRSVAGGLTARPTIRSEDAMSDEKKPKTFAEEIEEAVGDEPIQATIIGRYPDDEECPKDRIVRPELRGKLLAWNIARRALNYSRQGEETDCHAVFVYTPKHIYFLASYDGQDSIEWLPRNPTPKEPWFVGR